MAAPSRNRFRRRLRSLETGLSGLDEIEIEGPGQGDDKAALRAALGTPTPGRILMVAQRRAAASRSKYATPARSGSVVHHAIKDHRRPRRSAPCAHGRRRRTRMLKAAG